MKHKQKQRKKGWKKGTGKKKKEKLSQFFSCVFHIYAVHLRCGLFLIFIYKEILKNNIIPKINIGFYIRSEKNYRKTR